MTLHEKLRTLNLADKQVRGLQSRLDARSRRLKALQTKLAQYEQQLSELESQHKQTQAHAQTLETEANGMEERITALRDRMNSVTSNKEYSAMLVEVNTLKADKGKIEEEALTHMTKVDELLEQATAVKTQAEDQAKLVAGAQKELDDADSEVRERLDEVTAERQQAAAEVDAGTLRTYNELADTYEGEALAGIDEQDRKRMEYTCGACYMSLPIERVNAALTRPDSITTCPSCGRILLAASELKDALSAK